MDFTILREVARDSGVSVRWAPGSVQVADGLTKDKEEPCLRLKGVLRERAFQLAEEGECLRISRLEKERKQRLKELRAKSSSSSKPKKVLSDEEKHVPEDKAVPAKPNDTTIPIPWKALDENVTCVEHNWFVVYP